MSKPTKAQLKAIQDQFFQRSATPKQVSGKGASVQKPAVVNPVNPDSLLRSSDREHR